MNHICHVLYINLDRRHDRLTQITQELSDVNLLHKSTRISAIDRPDHPCYGCTLSHLKALKYARDMNYDNVLIVEDDAIFKMTITEINNRLTEFFNTHNSDYDVLQLASSFVIESSDNFGNNSFRRIVSASNGAGYIVNKRMYDTLITQFEKDSELLYHTKAHWLYINDQSWKNLQKLDNVRWYVMKPNIIEQRESYSDLALCVTNRTNDDKNSI